VPRLLRRRLHGHLPWTSKGLQRGIHTVYDEFLSNATVACSAPGTFFWAGEFVPQNGGIALLQKLPGRVWAALVPATRKHGIRLERADGEPCINCYTPERNEFARQAIEQKLAEKMESLIEAWWKAETGQMGAPGFEMRILSEIPRGRGINLRGAASAAIATALFLAWSHAAGGGVTDEDVARWREIAEVRRCSRRGLLPSTAAVASLDRVFALAFRFSSLLDGENCSGAAAMAPFMHSRSPIVYWSEMRTAHSAGCEGGSTALKGWDWDRQGPLPLSRLDYGAMALEQATGRTGVLDMAGLQFGLVFSGEPRKPAIRGTVAARIQELEAVAAYAKEALGTDRGRKANTGGDARRTVLHWWEKKQSFACTWETYLNAIAAAALEVMWSFTRPYASRDAPPVCRAVNRVQAALTAAGFSSPETERPMSALMQYYRTLPAPPESLGIKLLGSGGGDFLYVLPYHGLHDKRAEAMEHIASAAGALTPWLDYDTMLDGVIEDEGVRVEVGAPGSPSQPQDISSKDPRQRDKAIFEMWATGKHATYADLADELGLSERAVYCTIGRYRHRDREGYRRGMEQRKRARKMPG